MHFYLTLLRLSGKPLLAVPAGQPRLVRVRLVMEKCYRQAIATCCFGGATVAELWEPHLARIEDEDIVLQGFEKDGESGVVQEWRIRPNNFSPPEGVRSVFHGR